MQIKLSALLVFLVPLVLSGCGKYKGGDGDLTRFHGDWAVAEFTENGKPRDAKQLQQMQVAVTKEGRFQFQETVTDPSSTKVSIGKGETQETAMQVDNSKNPGEIDFVYLTGADTGKSKLGIFALEGSRWKICFAEVGQPRPTDFTSGDKTTLMVLERKQ